MLGSPKFTRFIAITSVVLTTISAQATGGKTFKAKDFRVDIPPAWKTIELGSNALDYAKSAFKTQEEKFLYEQAKRLSANKTIKLFAADPNSAARTGFANNLNVIVISGLIPNDNKALLEATKYQIDSLKNTMKILKPFALRKVGGYEFVSGTMQVTVGKHSFVTHSYSTIHNAKNFTFSFTCLPQDAANFSKIAESTLRSAKLN